MKFDDLKPGQVIRLDLKEGDWVGSQWHDVIYVNWHEREVLIDFFGRIVIITADQFEERNYLLDKGPERAKTRNRRVIQRA